MVILLNSLLLNYTPHVVTENIVIRGEERAQENIVVTGVMENMYTTW